jgi:hypothetical protein
MVQVDFPSRAFESYSIIDSEFSPNQQFTFSDSDFVLEAIDYSPFQGSSSVDGVYNSPANRTMEILRIRDEDLFKAMKEDNSLKFESNGKTYYNEEAYERKWYYNPNDDYARGYTAFVLDYQNGKTKVRGKELSYRYNPEVTQNRKTSYNQAAWSKGDTLWNNVYITEINNQIVEYDSDIQSYRDPKISMEGRR